MTIDGFEQAPSIAIVSATSIDTTAAVTAALEVEEDASQTEKLSKAASDSKQSQNSVDVKNAKKDKKDNLKKKEKEKEKEKKKRNRDNVEEVAKEVDFLDERLKDNSFLSKVLLSISKSKLQSLVEYVVK